MQLFPRACVQVSLSLRRDFGMRAFSILWMLDMDNRCTADLLLPNRVQRDTRCCYVLPGKKAADVVAKTSFDTAEFIGWQWKHSAHPGPAEAVMEPSQPSRNGQEMTTS
ncbi:unnamed protein product [Gadus morhua 'NCC']